MSGITLLIPIVPQAWQRQQTKIINGWVKHYNTNKLKNYENLIADAYRTNPKRQYFDQEQPLKVSIIFCMPIPKSYSKKRRKWILDGYEQHTKRPDIDNLAKAVIDGLNGVAFKDDSQIVQLNLRKEYAESPHIWVSIQPFI